MKPRHLDPETRDKLLRQLALHRSDPWCLTLELIARTGMRSAEVLSFDPLRDVNTLTSEIFVHALKGSSNRSVPVPEGFTRAILTYRAPERLPATFLRTLRRKWAKFRVKALGGGYGHCSLHGLRASFCVTAYKRLGQDILLCQQMMGHGSLGSTGAYLRLMEMEERKEEIRKAMGE